MMKRYRATLLVAIFAIHDTLLRTRGRLRFKVVILGLWEWLVVNYQIGNSAIGACHGCPQRCHGSGESLNSFSAYYAWSTYEYDESGYYLSLGFASAGYRSQMNYNSGGWTDDVVAPMGIVNLGYKAQWFSGI
ncbi:MAG: hypothetical protein U5L95_02660 [Candidatus Saccharibacteria bacterium]|nr:hypothetical protein [Candidatus Saccharibacteria bacterium]